MIGFYIYSNKVNNDENFKRNRYFYTSDTYIIAGGCCMGIDNFTGKSQPTMEILIPYKCQEDGEPIVLTLEEIQTWFNLIKGIGIPCEITDTEFIWLGDQRTDGSYCVVSFKTLQDNTFTKYNLLVLSLFRYMFNRGFKYREIYETTLKLLELVPEEDFITLLHLAHIFVINASQNNTRGGSTLIYTQYYGLFPDLKNSLFNSKELIRRVPTGNYSYVNALCETPAYSYNMKELLKAFKDKDSDTLRKIIKNAKI